MEFSPVTPQKDIAHPSFTHTVSEIYEKCPSQSAQLYMMADPTFCSFNLYPSFLSLVTVLLNTVPNKAQKYNWFKKKVLFCQENSPKSQEL